MTDYDNERLKSVVRENEQLIISRDNLAVMHSTCGAERLVLEDQLSAAKAEIERLRAAAERADSDLTCDEQHCWCFTRAAMPGPSCVCANCTTWRLFRATTAASR